MLYDTQTGWIFTSENFRDLLINQNHMKIYKGLLYEKNQQLSKFLQINNNNELPKEEIEKNQLDESKLEQEIEPLELEDMSIDTAEEDKPQKSIDYEDITFEIKMPKIQVPKIYIPKISIHTPRIKKVDKK